MSQWFEEELEPGLRFCQKINRTLASSINSFQRVEMIDTLPFGKVLVIDGLTQSAELDEYIYHECLVHPAMFLHPNPKTVFIGGGGEGCTAREVLRHKTVEKCVMVDIDAEVVKFCQDHLPSVKGAFADPRLELIIDCAKTRLENSPITFDVIIMDLDDPLEGGPCFKLYTQSFYEECKKKLNPGGLFVTQCSAAGPKAFRHVFGPVNHTLKQVFPKVFPYNQAIYSFGDEWGFCLAATDPNTQLPQGDELDKLISQRIEGGTLKFLDSQSFVGIFAINKTQRLEMAQETRILSENRPPAFFSGLKPVCQNNESGVTA